LLLGIGRDGEELVREEVKGNWGYLDLPVVEESNKRSAYFDKGVGQEEENERLMLEELPGKVANCVGSGPARWEVRRVEILR
jgi:hypothetical protein